MDKLRKIKTIRIRQLRAEFPTDPLLKKLIVIFLLVFVSQLFILNSLFPIEKVNWIPPPLKIPFPSKPTTIQDRFEYSFKDVQAQINEELITKIKAQINPPPGKVGEPLELLDLSGREYALFIDKIIYRVNEILSYKRNRFFVEYGAWDGSSYSNELYFERMRGFKGLIIEPDPRIFQWLLHLRRNAWIINSGVSIHPTEKQCEFFRLNDYGRRVMKDFSKHLSNEDKNGLDSFNATCFPLTSILLAINQTTIDLLILDMEGASLNILKTIAWDKFNINVILVIEGPNHNDKEESLEKCMIKQGFLTRGIIQEPFSNAHIFQNTRL
ncbi:unnamed protein product [Allacma fusca]|uniref:Methyltransferase FkbM domain-containing protein n=1 Tax=Allacma fusca TaxID=39272 RepID=A0A8J2JNA7_9HEXA|nr:unnamed protein product [Allacma fusca]